MKDQKGFTLVEVVIASMLLGMVFLTAFPLINVGYQVIKSEQIRTEAQLIGDSIFERISSELQNNETMKSGMYAESERILEDAINPWERIETLFPGGGFDVEVESEPMDEGWTCLTVTLKKEGDIVYKRSEMIYLLNYEGFGPVLLKGD